MQKRGRLVRDADDFPHQTMIAADEVIVATDNLRLPPDSEFKGPNGFDKLLRT
jgi:hypothetical protein